MSIILSTWEVEIRKIAILDPISIKLGVVACVIPALVGNIK
jgi:hypothetical protein